MGKDKHLSFVDRLIEQTLGNGMSVGLPDDPGKQKWPELWEWLTTVYYDHDKIKVPPTLTIVAGPGGFVVRVTDRDMSKSCEIVSPHLHQVFDLLEAELCKPLPNIKSLGKREPTIRTRKKQ